MVGLCVVLFAGLGHGLLTNRWQFSDEPRASAAKLEQVSTAWGDWSSTPLELSAQSLAIGEIAGYLDRILVNQQTGAEVATLVVCGRPGPISQHPPDVCYAGEGYVLEKKDRRTFDIEGLKAPAEFWVGRFRKNEAGLPVYLRIFWAWSPDGTWQAPDNPRLRFASYPDLSHQKIGPRYRALYKLYVHHIMAAADDPIEGDPGLEVIKLLLPELQRSLFQ
jgi:hypothetical protein